MLSCLTSESYFQAQSKVTKVSDPLDELAMKSNRISGVGAPTGG